MVLLSRVLWFALVLAPCVGHANSDTRPRGRDSVSVSEPVVIVLMLDGDAVAQAREQRFLSEIRLALDGFVVEAVDTGLEGFTELVLKDKLSHLRQLSAQHGAVAITWIEDAGPDVTMLHMVALSTGRAFVRIVEADKGPGAEAELALAAQELLGQVHLLSPPGEDEAIDQAVELVRQRAASVRAAGAPVSLGIMPLLEVEGRMRSQDGPWLRFGGGLALELWILSHLYARAAVIILAGPIVEPHDGTITGWGLEPGLNLGYDWRIGEFAFGPFVGISVTKTTVSMTLGTGDHQSFDWWDVRGSLGFDLRWAASESLSLVLAPCLAVSTKQKNFRRVSDDSIVIRTPFLRWAVAMGVAYRF